MSEAPIEVNSLPRENRPGRGWLRVLEWRNLGLFG